MQTEPYDFDFAVAGSGPAGASAAISLAQMGHSVVLFEREKFPRFHIGESLLATANESFAALGVTDRMNAACFPQKWGARLLTHDGKSGRGIDFASVNEVMEPSTFQVDRAVFDRLLMERAKDLGVDVREAHRVTGCEFTRDAALVDFVPDGGEKGRVRARAIVDGTGRHGLIARKFNLRKNEPRLANIAVYSHYSGVPRLAGDRPDDIRIIARSDSGWFWMIPISVDLMSVGVVMPKNLFLQTQDVSNEVLLERAISDTPVVTKLMQHARRKWPVRVEKDFSYSASTYAGERWILVGDAGSFLDPVFSTGVSVAMESGIESAHELNRALIQNDFSARRFAAFSRRQRKRFKTFRRFVIGFYTPQFRDIFFVPEPPEQIFRAVVTVLCGRWDASLRTRLLNQIFFAAVALQKHFQVARRRFRRDAAAGYFPGS